MDGYSSFFVYVTVVLLTRDCLLMNDELIRMKRVTMLDDQKSVVAGRRDGRVWIVGVAQERWRRR